MSGSLPDNGVFHYTMQTYEKLQEGFMKKPILVIMAAGMGSRYGKLKQLDSVGVYGEAIMEFSIYDAMQAGFETVVFIIKHSFEKEFKEKIGNKIARHMEVRYAFQDLNDLPEGFTVPAGREKPWGTAHAIYAARDVIDAPFAVINADDYYGPRAFLEVFDFLARPHDHDYRYCMVSYLLKNTTTDSGSVSRGICETDRQNNLIGVTEHLKIEETISGIRCTDDDGASYHELSGDALVSMNLWGLFPSFIDEVGKRLQTFLEEACQNNPLKAEYYLPTVINELLAEKKATVKVLSTTDKWYGITYHEDKPKIVLALSRLTRGGSYPMPIWQ